MKLPSYILFFYEGIVLLYVLTKNFVVCVPVHFLFFFTAAHFHLAGGSLLATSISHFLTAAMKFSCFSSNQNLSPLFLITSSSSFSVIHMSVDNKNKSKKT